MATRNKGPQPIDMAAVSRIARRVNLTNIRLTKLSAEAPEFLQPGGGLLAQLDQDHTFEGMADKGFVVSCNFQFIGKQAKRTLAELSIQYLLFYELKGDDPVADEDLRQFAKANGAYHSWPFARELIHNLTLRIGLPPFTLPVLTFAPRRLRAGGSGRKNAALGTKG